MLLVHSDPFRRDELAQALRTFGFTVTAVRCVAEVEEWPYGDIVITEARFFSQFWLDVGAAHVLVLGDVTQPAEAPVTVVPTFYTSTRIVAMVVALSGRR